MGHFLCPLINNLFFKRKNMSVKACLNCQYVLSVEDVFCPECGTKHSEQSAQSAILPTQAESSQAGSQASSITSSAAPFSSPTPEVLSQQFSSGQFLYKAVTFDSYMLEVLGDRRKEFALDMSMTNSFKATADYLNGKIIGLVNDMFNYYGRQGWEYWNQIDVPVARIQEMAEISGNNKSALSFMAAGIKAGLKDKLGGTEDMMPTVFTHYIFRKVALK